MYITLEDIKKHLNIDHEEDDAYLVELIKVAEDSISTYLNRPLSELCDHSIACPHEELKPSVRHGIRLIVGTWYANRESVTFSAPSRLPDALTALLLPLKKFE